MDDYIATVLLILMVMAILFGLYKSSETTPEMIQENSKKQILYQCLYVLSKIYKMGTNSFSDNMLLTPFVSNEITQYLNTCYTQEIRPPKQTIELKDFVKSYHSQIQK